MLDCTLAFDTSLLSVLGYGSLSISSSSSVTLSYRLWFLDKLGMRKCRFPIVPYLEPFFLSCSENLTSTMVLLTIDATGHSHAWTYFLEGDKHNKAYAQPTNNPYWLHLISAPSLWSSFTYFFSVISRHWSHRSLKNTS
jgi:hypothetical protein